MKPVERGGYVDIWILIQQTSDGKFMQSTGQINNLGNGFFANEKDAQHQQTMDLLKGNKTQVFHLEWPLL